MDIGYSQVVTVVSNGGPGGELGIPTDRDQRSWVFLRNPKNTLALKENPKKYFPKSETLKNTANKHNSFSES